jgi:HAE1 family hydrophobic/amphiphilic exporter-1
MSLQPGRRAGILQAILRRPVAVLLAHVSLALFGILGWINLPFNRMPDVEYPTIVVSAALPGATPDMMSVSVAAPLEARVCGVAGLLDCSTTCVSGAATIILRFRSGHDMGTALGEVNRAVRAAAGDLPASMTDPPVCQRYNPTDTPLLYMALESPGTLEAELEEMARIRVATPLASLPGVARVNLQGGGRFSWVVRADPLALAGRGISPVALQKAVMDLVPGLPWGRLGGQERDSPLEGEGPVGATGLFPDKVPLPGPPAEGKKPPPPVWLSDVATVSPEASRPRSGKWLNGKPCVILSLYREVGTNALALGETARAELEKIRANLPGGANLRLVYDNTRPVRAAIDEMMITLWLSVALVLAIIGLGLRDWRGTLICCSVVPLSITGMMGFLWLAGFSLNTLTLLALSLAIGFVVDDAIVVLENVVRHREMGKPALEASVEGASEVAFTMVSITVSLLAVFLPILLVPDILGRMFREFALTLMGCITLSGLVSLLLVPVLCLWLPSCTARHPAASGTAAIPPPGLYARLIGWLIAHPWVGIVGIVLFLLGTSQVSAGVRKGFLPVEDKSLLLLFTKAEPEVSWDRLQEAHRRLWEIIAGVPEVEETLTFLGQDEVNTTASDGLLLLRLKYPPRRSIAQVTADLQARLDRDSPLAFSVFNLPSLYLNTKRTKSLYQVLVTAPRSEDLPLAVAEIRQWMEEKACFLSIDTDIEPGAPTLQISPERAQMGIAGFSATDGAGAVQGAFGPAFTANLWAPAATRSLSVGFRSDRTVRPEDLHMVRLNHSPENSPGSNAPLEAMTDSITVVLARQANRYNRLPAASLSFNLPPEADSSAVLASLEERLASISEQGVRAELVGISREVRSSVVRAMPLVLLSFVVMYLTLGFLYESLTHPVTVLATLPSALFGGLLGLWLFDIELDIYGFFGLLMLLGLVKKNAIILVDFARARQMEGVEASRAILEASIERLRPIQLTTMAAAAGAIPMLVGTGSGISVLKPVGAILLGGLIVSQVVTLAFTPPLYRFMEELSMRVRRWVRLGGSQ